MEVSVVVLDVCLELNQSSTLPQATPFDLGPRTPHGAGGGIAERA